MPIPENFPTSGNPEHLQIQLPLMEMMYICFKEIEEQIKAIKGGGGTSRPLPVDVKGKLILKLYFEGYMLNTQTMHQAEKSFRLMKDDPRTISLERIRLLGERTKSKFTNFKFTTGHVSYTYNVPEQGFNRTWGFFKNRAEAKRLYEQMLDLDSYSPNWQRLSTSLVEEPGDRFAEVADKVLQANVSIRSERERPIANVEFTHATLKFPHLRDEVDLVDKAGHVLDSLLFLASYQS
jgi:hypothetical protein